MQATANQHVSILPDDREEGKTFALSCRGTKSTTTLVDTHTCILQDNATSQKEGVWLVANWPACHDSFPPKPQLSKEGKKNSASWISPQPSILSTHPRWAPPSGVTMAWDGSNFLVHVWNLDSDLFA